MADNSKLNSLLKWAVENSDGANGDEAGATDQSQGRDAERGLDAAALAELMGGPSDADLMKQSMAAIMSPDVDLENKLVAFDNFEQLIENLDNANNMEALGLWMHLVDQLKNDEPELRRMAAWCCGTAVQNNPRSQERLLVLNAIPQLVKLSREDKAQATRKKAVFAISSEVRNYQPALDVLIQELPDDYPPAVNIDAGDMEAVDGIITKMREDAQKGAFVQS